MIDPYAASTAHPRPQCPLTPDELAVVRRLADGEKRQRIARSLNLSVAGLNTAIRRMFPRVNATNSTHLVAIALRAGWIR